jgi:hypothetical protein
VLPIADPAPVAPPAQPKPAIRPALPFIYTFAVGDTRTPVACVVPDEIARVDVSDGACRPPDASDWFAARTPAIPPVTGPLRVPGVAPGDILNVEVLEIEPHGVTQLTPLALVVQAAPSAAGHQGVQATIAAGQSASVSALQPGGLLFIGPVFAQGREIGSGIAPSIAATVSIRVTVSRPPGA